MGTISDASKTSSVASEDSKNTVEALTAKKEPPPEVSSSIRNRRWVILSFWLLAILLGLPTWWKTTTVYRATLPLEAMSNWADGKVWLCLIVSQNHS